MHINADGRRYLRLTCSNANEHARRTIDCVADATSTLDAKTACAPGTASGGVCRTLREVIDALRAGAAERTELRLELSLSAPSGGAVPIANHALLEQLRKFEPGAAWHDACAAVAFVYPLLADCKRARHVQMRMHTRLADESAHADAFLCLFALGGFVLLDSHPSSSPNPKVLGVIALAAPNGEAGPYLRLNGPHRAWLHRGHLHEGEEDVTLPRLVDCGVKKFLFMPAEREPELTQASVAYQRHAMPDGATYDTVDEKPRLSRHHSEPLKSGNRIGARSCRIPAGAFVYLYDRESYNCLFKVAGVEQRKRDEFEFHTIRMSVALAAAPPIASAAGVR